ncbi:glycosyltransferase [candidate division TA06 bacterium]|nr:glycosyltransferase [candidate division TA06 bacterium]
MPDASIYHYGQQGTQQIKVRSYLRHVISYLKLFHKYHWRLDERYQASFKRPYSVSRLTLVLAAHNQKCLLDECLKSIYDDPPKMPYNVLVVDDASNDGSLEMLKEKYPQVLWIANQSPKGYWFAVNQALQMTESEYLALVPLRPEAIFGQFQKLHDFLEQRPKAALAGLVTGKSWQKKDGISKCSERKMFLENSMMFRRRVIDKSGIPNERTAMTDREFKWCADLRRAGWGVYYLLTA